MVARVWPRLPITMVKYRGEGVLKVHYGHKLPLTHIPTGNTQHHGGVNPVRNGIHRG